ncbi:MAG: hypothetical protein RL375_2707 [Pseudomonadota bacterium]|jgi:hypothetical protein
MPTFNKFALAAAALALSHAATAHVGTSNLTTPSVTPGQATYLIGNVTSELVFNVGHGCNAEAVPAVTPALDTYKVSITVPADIVTATGTVRPTFSGAYGNATLVTNANGSVTATWVKSASARPGDDHYYKVALRLKAPTTTTIKAYQFDAVQYCKATATTPGGGVAEGADVVLDWTKIPNQANQSPTVYVFPDKRKGFNSFKLDASVTAAFTATATGTLASVLKSHFGDAEILWVGKAGYSANATTAAKIDALATKDSSYSNLGTKVGGAISATDTIWVKY